MKTILCYGDSNTWGSIPRWQDSTLPSERYDEDTRWTKRLAKILGDDYRVIEEGLGGRTTIYDVIGAPEKNGLPYLKPCLLSHRPLDLVVIMLGTNDLHLSYRLDENDLGRGITELIQVVQSTAKCGVGFTVPPILIVSPIEVIQPDPQGRMSVYDEFYRNWGVHLSQRFPSVYQEIASQYGCYYLNAACHAKPSPADGVHLTPEGHAALADGIAAKIRDIFSSTSL